MIFKFIIIMKTKNKHINCYLCKYYYVTWNKKFPHGCRAMGFKSRMLPSIEVYKHSGIYCLLFNQKKISRKENLKKNKDIIA